MFGFDGEYRRRPLQSLGGASQSRDRDSIIRKAQQERQKRNEIRRQNNGAIVLQSYTRSFLNRQRCKRNFRDEFDNFLQTNRDKVMVDDNLAYLLRRLLFFYDQNIKDGERLIDICQYILKNPGKLMQNAAVEFIWLHRLKKLLDLCVTQLSLLNLAQAIPLRILETFTSISSIERYVENDEHIHLYLDRIYNYLVHRKYFLRLRSILEKRCPPLDSETINAPNQISQAVLDLMLRPLLLANQMNVYPQATTICKAFAKHILSAPLTDRIRFFVLPYIANYDDFPFEHLIRSLKQLLDLYEKNLIEKRQIETNILSNSITTSFTGASTKPPTISTKENSFDDKKLNIEVEEIFTSYLMNSILILDRNQIELINKKSLLGDYIHIIGKISHKILKLPKGLVKHVRRIDNPNSEYLSSDEDDYDDDDDIRDKDMLVEKDIEMELMPAENEYVSQTYSSSTTIRQYDNGNDVLLESIDLLNESDRIHMITDHIEKYLTNATVLHALCEICHNLMIFNRLATIHYKLINSLSFMPHFIRSVWFTLATESSQLGFSAPLTLISKGVIPREHGIEKTIPLLATFCILFGRLLPTLHDAEFREDNPIVTETIQRQMPFSMVEIVQLSKTLKEISMGLVELAFPDTRTVINEHYRTVLGRTDMDERNLKQQKKVWANLLKVVVFVLNQIHTRDLRLNFCPDGHWTISRLDLPLDRPTDLPLTRSSRMRGLRPFQPIRDFTREDFKQTQPMSTKQIRSITILREIPFVVPFSKRVGILQGLVAADKIRIQGNLQAFLQGPSIMLVVRRSHLYEDAYDKLRPENEPDLRLKFRVQFVSSLGLDEAGIDGGGVFREFLSELIKTAFDPNRGFFMVTTDNKLYPNPNVSDLVADYEKHYYFIGRILGKAIYENLLVELPLAEFFLTKLAGKYADVDIHQLASLDPELYKNLLYLKDYEGDVSELNLDFTVASNSFGHTQIVELIQNGQSTAVTASNRIEYLQLMADYKLNVQIRKHCIAFRKGLSDVLPIEWLYMFSNKELQILISGAEIPIDLEDLKKHCKYGGEYSPEHPSIIVFWSTLESFNDLQKRQLLKFVTSCSRPPLLGFKDLDPPFFIQNAGDMERLPTASTCTNLLKLPPFKTIEQMREKLLYAIQSGVGFELS